MRATSLSGASPRERCKLKTEKLEYQRHLKVLGNKFTYTRQEATGFGICLLAFDLALVQSFPTMLLFLLFGMVLSSLEFISCKSLFGLDSRTI